MWTRNCGERGDPDEPNTPGWELQFAPDLAHDRVIDKTRSNVFENTPLSQWIPEDAEILVMGLQSEFGIRSTCSVALGRGNHVSLVKGGHATYSWGERSAGQIQYDAELELEEAGVVLLDPSDVTFS